jgi:hypothetical protein
MTCTPTYQEKWIENAAPNELRLDCTYSEAYLYFYQNTLNHVLVRLTSTGVTPPLPHPAPAGVSRVVGEKFTITPYGQALARSAKLYLDYNANGVAANKARICIVDPNGWQPLPEANHVYVSGRLSYVNITGFTTSGNAYVVVEMA